MTILPIRKYPDPVLKQVAKPIDTFDEGLKKFARNMRETMYAANGVGLASPQVGVSKRILVLDVSDKGDEPMEFVNPEIIKVSGSTSSEEGCLSIPDYRDSLKRHKQIVVKAQDLDGKPFEIEADGILAICLQHEIDHLDGVLFVDRLSRLKREMFKRWLKKQGPLE